MSFDNQFFRRHCYAVNRQSSIVNRQSSIVKNSVKTFTRLSSACLVGLVLSEASFAANCTTAVVTPPGTNRCSCTDGTTMQSEMFRGAGTPGQTISTVNVKKCLNALDSICNETVGSDDISSTQFYKNTSGTGYYRCDWADGSGFSNPQMYTPAPSGNAVSAPIFDLKPAQVFATEVEETK